MHNRCREVRGEAEAEAEERQQVLRAAVVAVEEEVHQ